MDTQAAELAAEIKRLENRQRQFAAGSEYEKRVIYVPMKYVILPPSR